MWAVTNTCQQELLTQHTIAQTWLAIAIYSIHYTHTFIRPLYSSTPIYFWSSHYLVQRPLDQFRQRSFTMWYNASRPVSTMVPNRTTHEQVWKPEIAFGCRNGWITWLLQKSFCYMTAHVPGNLLGRINAVQSFDIHLTFQLLERNIWSFFRQILKIQRYWTVYWSERVFYTPH